MSSPPARSRACWRRRVTPLVTDQTDSVEARLDHSLDFLETRLAALERDRPGKHGPGTGPGCGRHGGSRRGCRNGRRRPEPAPTADRGACTSGHGSRRGHRDGRRARARAHAGPDSRAPAGGVPVSPGRRSLAARYRVRAAPDLQAAVVETLAPGAAVCVQEGRDGWSRLRAPEGWIVDEGLIPLPVAG